MKTFIKWSGNKSKYLKKILLLLPNSYNTYIEPFVGSGALFLSIKPNKWIINDVNSDLINLWKQIKLSSDDLLKHLSYLKNIFSKLSKDEQLALCRRWTKQFSSMQSKLQKACMYMFLKNLVYMGMLTRYNKLEFSGFDMTYLKNRESVYIFSEKFAANLVNINQYMKTTSGKIYNKDFKYILNKAKENDFVFLDPPYIETHNYEFNYNINEKLSNVLLEELFFELHKLDEKGVKWMMTQADTKEVKHTFRKYKITSYKVFRRQSATHKKELIITNY